MSVVAFHCERLALSYSFGQLGPVAGVVPPELSVAAGHDDGQLSRAASRVTGRVASAGRSIAAGAGADDVLEDARVGEELVVGCELLGVALEVEELLDDEHELAGQPTW